MTLQAIACTVRSFLTGYTPDSSKIPSQIESDKQKDNEIAAQKIQHIQTPFTTNEAGAKQPIREWTMIHKENLPEK